MTPEDAGESIAHYDGAAVRSEVAAALAVPAAAAIQRRFAYRAWNDAWYMVRNETAAATTDDARAAVVPLLASFEELGGIHEDD